MTPAGDVIENPAGLMRLRVMKGASDTNGELLEMEATYEPGSVEPLVHFHPRQDEHFEVVSGSIRAHVGRDERALGAGDVLDVPAGTVHAMWNDGEGEANVIWQTRPALRSEDFFRTVGALAQQGKLTSKGPRNPLVGASLLYRFRDEFRLAYLPRLVQLVALPPLGPRRVSGGMRQERATAPSCERSHTGASPPLPSRSYPPPMTSAVRIEGELTSLRDGTALLVRQVQPADKGLLAAGFERLSPESRYRRFFSPIQRLSERDLAYLTEIDHHDHEALAAIDPETDELVGVARYVRGAEPHLAEVSVVVGDPWQQRGVATLLLERLVERARAAAVTHFVALVMSENSEALRLFEHRVPGHAEPRRSKSGHLELLIELPDPGQLPHSALGRLLRATARRAVIVNPYRVMRHAIRRLRTAQ